MHNRRSEPRMLCADLVDVCWKDKNGRTRHAVANLEDISLSGACIQVDKPVPLGSPMRISYPHGQLQGQVCYCVCRDDVYYLGVEFDPGCHWSPRQFRPQHLLDPRTLVNRVVRRTVRFQPSQTIH